MQTNHQANHPPDNGNIGFISTRYSGTDGVSLEETKWKDVLENRLGKKCFFLSGEFDLDNLSLNGNFMQDHRFFFKDKDILEIDRKAFGSRGCARDRSLTRKVHEIKERMKDTIYDFNSRFGISMYIVSNALTIPMNLPLGIALTEAINETKIPTILHHHDFAWERERYIDNCVFDILSMAFPPVAPNIYHVVLNKDAQESLSFRKGVSSKIIPNVMDFNVVDEEGNLKYRTDSSGTPIYELDEYASTLRESLGVPQDDLFILQPTRVIRRKRIERSIDLVSRLGKKASLVVSHEHGDEGEDNYLEELLDYAKEKDVRLILAGDRINCRRREKNGNRMYTLEDVYLNADLVTLPSSQEGYGNALIEAIKFKRPVVVNRFKAYRTDIDSIGFDLILLQNENYNTKSDIQTIRELLESPEKVKEMTAQNYLLGKEHCSYEVLEDRLKETLKHFSGTNGNSGARHYLH